MATLDDIIDEQNKIHAELERMAADENTTEDEDGGIRDTLVKQWKQLDAQRARITGRLEELNLIRAKSAEIANTEHGDGGGQAQRMTGSRGPEFMVRKDPLADRDDTQDYTMLPRSEVVSRACDADRAARQEGVAARPRRGRHPLRAGPVDRPAHADVRRRRVLRGVPRLRERPDGPRPAACRRRIDAGQRPGRLPPALLPGPHDRDHYRRHHQSLPPHRERQADHHERLPGRQLRRGAGRVRRRAGRRRAPRTTRASGRSRSS